jgi:hypothetical protein
VDKGAGQGRYGRGSGHARTAPRAGKTRDEIPGEPRPLP